MTHKIIDWLATTRLLLWFRKIPKEFLRRAKGVIIYYNTPEKSRIFNLIESSKKEVNLGLNYAEAYQLFAAVQSTKKIKGDIVEVGVYRGGSAKLICEAKGDKLLHFIRHLAAKPLILLTALVPHSFAINKK